jgi:hypothetical protein
MSVLKLNTNIAAAFLLAAVGSACSSSKNQSFESDSSSMGSVESVGSSFGGGGSSVRIPKVALKPFESGGLWMNAYYFVRGESENWESLSTQLYGRSDRAQLISSWNKGGSLRVGRLVYYNSPFRPDDSQNMKVFAEDFGQQMNEVVVEAGDWLSKIGKSTYGNVLTYIEIAALNPEIQNPNLIYPGQKLRLQPANVDTQSALRQLLAAAEQSEEASQGVGQVAQEVLKSIPGGEAAVESLRKASGGLIDPILAALKSREGLFALAGILVVLALVSIVAKRRRGPTQSARAGPPKVAKVPGSRSLS